MVAISLKPEHWQATITISPPLQETIKEIYLDDQIDNIKILNVDVINKDIALNKYKEHFQDENQQRIFFNKQQIHKYYMKDTSSIEAFRLFRTSMNINNGQFSFIFSSPTLSNKILFNYSQFINDITVNFLLENTKKHLKLKQVTIENKINRIMKNKKDDIENELYVINDAIKIAKLINLKGLMANQQINQTSPVYFRGYLALKAEKKILQEKLAKSFTTSREIKELEIINNKINKTLNSLLDNREIFLFSIARKQATIINMYSKSVLLVMLSIIFGFALSFFIIFFQNLILSKKLYR